MQQAQWKPCIILEILRLLKRALQIMLEVIKIVQCRVFAHSALPSSRCFPAPFVPYSMKIIPPFGSREMLSCTTSSGDFCSEDGCGSSNWILKKLLCPVYSLLGWITGKGCYIVHRTKHSWHEKWACMFTVCTLQVIF